MPPENELDMLLLQLDELSSRTRRGDAIEKALDAAPRESAAKPLREHEIVRKFRQELVDGRIRLDTANQFLGLVRTVLDAAVMP